MGSSKIADSVNKYSTLEVVRKTTQILAVIENHIDNDNCEHCRELLKNAGLAAQPDGTRTNTIQQPLLNHEVQEVIRESQ